MKLLNLCDNNSLLLKFGRRYSSSHTFFEKYSEKWWDIDGDMPVLHDYNQVRIPFIANSYLNRLKNTTETKTDSDNRNNNLFGIKPLKIFEEPYKRSSVHIEAVLKGVNILDVGCGGGILTESLAKFGCKVLGIDPNEKLIEVAKSHKKQFFDNYHIRLGLRDNYSLNLDYKATTVYDLLAEETNSPYDIVVASEVIEHIDNREKDKFFETLARLVKPGGILVITTPGSSLISYLINIFFAENIFKKIPKHTHNFNLFISPRDCLRTLTKFNFNPVLKQGLLYLPYLRRKMELKGFVRKFGKGDSFDPLKDSKIGGDPVFPDSVKFEAPMCDLCSSPMNYLMQLSVSHSKYSSRDRILYVYYCINDATRDKGWKIYRYNADIQSNTFSGIGNGSISATGGVNFGTDEPVFGEMNSVSSWIDGLNISSTKTVDDAHDDILRVILENDVVQEDCDVHSMVLLEKYKNKGRDEIDEEDLIDFKSIKYSEDQADGDDEDDDTDVDGSDVSGLDEEVEAINNFHKYMSSRPNIILRVNWGGRPISFLTNVEYASSCSNCGSPSVFELQLLPNIVKYLTKPASSGREKRASVDNNISMCLGGVVFCTCGSDCSTSELVQEHSHVLLYQ